MLDYVVSRWFGPVVLKHELIYKYYNEEEEQVTPQSTHLPYSYVVLPYPSRTIREYWHREIAFGMSIAGMQASGIRAAYVDDGKVNIMEQAHFCCEGC